LASRELADLVQRRGRPGQDRFSPQKAADVRREVPRGSATRFDAFTQWGLPIEDDPTMSLQPPNVSDGDNMKVGEDPKNYYSKDIETSYVTNYSLDFDSPGVKSVRKSLQVSPDIRSKPRPAKRI
jgi:hypothetical protein